MAEEDLRFHAADWAVFVIALLAAASVGVVQGVRDILRKKRGEKEEECVGERNLSPWPASLSIMASVSAAPFVLGIPAEIYFFGTIFAMFALAYLIGLPLMTHLFFDRWYSMRIGSMYEYLALRYNVAMRSLATGTFAFGMLIYTGIIIYAPALAFSQVTGISTTLCILFVGGVGIVYTVVGGLKGVLWVDAIQMIIILIGVLLVIIRGSVDVGGLGVVWSRAEDGGRIIFDEFSWDLTMRHTFWTQVLGGIFFVCVMFSNQAVVQKLLGLQTKKHMYITSYVSAVCFVVYFLLFVLAGLVIYANFYQCDPLLTGVIQEVDQLVPYFVLKTFQDVHGISGLFTSAVFGASLSTLAAGINAIAGLTLIEVVQPLYKRLADVKEMPQNQAGLIFKLLVVIYGALTVGVAFLAPVMGDSVLQIGLSIVGTMGAPILAVFFMGVLCPFVNSTGAIVATCIATPLMMWLNIAAVVTDVVSRTAIPLTLRVDGCVRPDQNITGQTTHSPVTEGPVAAAFTESGGTMDDTNELSGLDDFYAVSYMWYSMMGVIITVVIGCVVSLATGGRKGEPVNTDLSFQCCYKHTERDDQFPLRTDSNGAPPSYDNLAYTVCRDDNVLPAPYMSKRSSITKF